MPLKKYLIGIDDTDNLESRGTGFRAREMGSQIESNNLGILHGITRHQLYFHRDIPYTSHNSSACLLVESETLSELTEFCREYLKTNSAEGSDAGLCIGEFDEISENVIKWGKRAKCEILTQAEAKKTAEENGLYLEGFLGTRDGIIGSMAAVGLRKAGDDGRFLWLKGKELREFSGVYILEDLYNSTDFEIFKTMENVIAKPGDRVFIEDWIRPVMIENKITVIIEKSINNENYEWRIASKDFIKSISN
jgi:hypothetical protein